MLAALTARYSQLHPSERFELDLKSTRSAPPALLAGQSDIAPMGAPMEPDDIGAFRARWGYPPVQVNIAHASLQPSALSSPTGIFVHERNPIACLSLRALHEVFAAAAEMPWRALGVDRSGPIRLYGLSEETAIGRFMLRRLRLAGRFPETMRRFSQSRDAAAAIAGDGDALGFANLNHARPGLRALAIVDRSGRIVEPVMGSVYNGTWPFDRKLMLYLRRRSDGLLAKQPGDFVRFVLSDEGQRIIANGRKGYLPLNRNERQAELIKIEKSIF